MYIKFQDKATIYFDVDDTLVLHNISKKPEKAIFIRSTATDIAVIPNTIMINKLVELKKQGNIIVVWSGGGADWAEAVINSLNLQNYVDCILSKPFLYFDDLDSTEWMPTRSYES